MRPLLLACIVPFALVVASAADPPAKLAAQLGDRDFHAREAAGKQLDALGEAALPALKHAATTGSPEAARRAQALAQRITARIENEKVLAPKLVTLDFRDAPFATVAEAIRKQTGCKLEITAPVVKQTGAELEIVGDPSLDQKHVTVRLTKRPFWEAVDELAKQVGLSVGSMGSERTLLLQRRLEDATRMHASSLEDWHTATNRAKAKARLAACEEELRKIEVDWIGFERQTSGKSLGVVTLFRSPAPPSSNAHVMRIEAVPFPNNMSEVSTNVIPLVLKVTPEPGTCWGGATEVSISKSVTTDGITLSQGLPYLPPQAPPVNPVGWGPIASYTAPTILDTRLGRFYPGSDAVALLNVPRRGTVTKLAVVEGIVRGELWRSGRRYQVEIPFKLTDVPVMPGTHDPNAKMKEQELPLLPPIAAPPIPGVLVNPLPLPVPEPIKP